MSVLKAGLFRRAALALVVAASVLTPAVAKADGFLDGFSIRAGFYRPSQAGARSLTDTGAWGIGVDYQLPWFPKLLNGEGWTTSISADFHYSERSAGVLRYIPVAINQIYTFEERNGNTPYAGFSLVAATVGSTGTSPKQATVTRFGFGLLVGLNWGDHLYSELHYDWIDKHGMLDGADGFRAYLGWRL